MVQFCTSVDRLIHLHELLGEQLPATQTCRSSKKENRRIPSLSRFIHIQLVHLRCDAFRFRPQERYGFTAFDFHLQLVTFGNGETFLREWRLFVLLAARKDSLHRTQNVLNRDPGQTCLPLLPDPFIHRLCRCALPEYRSNLVRAYWLQKFFGYKRNGRAQFVKNQAIWGEDDSWAETISTSPALVPPDIDPAIEKLARRQFKSQIKLLQRTFEAVKQLASETRENIYSAHVPETLSATRLPVLTVREREIIQLMAQGYRNKKIGEKLFISDQTLNKRLSEIR